MSIETVARLPAVENALLVQEVPVLAATPAFLRDLERGSVTGAFLDALPPDWHSDIIVDSALVWLPAGASPGPRFFHREPFPGATQGARAVANEELASEHITCCAGVDVGEVFAVGLLEDLIALKIDAPQTPPRVAAALAERHRLIEARIESGEATRLRVPPGTLYRHSATAMRRFDRAPVSGFHFIIRATRGSRRPAACLLRTVSSGGF